MVPGNLAPATGFHSGTRLLEGFKRFSQEPPQDLLSSEWSSASARAEKALLLDRKMRSVACSSERAKGSGQECPLYTSSPHVHKRWKSCWHSGLTVSNGASNLNGFRYKFRGQPVCTSVRAVWTEGAPLRRKADRSLTTRLNVPVVRWKSRVRIRAISQDRPLRLSSARVADSALGSRVLVFGLSQKLEAKS